MRIRIIILKLLIKCSSIYDSGSMSERTTRLLSRLVELETKRIPKKENYRIVK